MTLGSGLSNSSGSGCVVVWLGQDKTSQLARGCIDLERGRLIVLVVDRVLRSLWGLL